MDNNYPALGCRCYAVDAINFIRKRNGRKCQRNQLEARVHPEDCCCSSSLSCARATHSHKDGACLEQEHRMQNVNDVQQQIQETSEHASLKGLQAHSSRLAGKARLDNSKAQEWHSALSHENQQMLLDDASRCQLL